uniref:NB-ARC domain containing protein n=1 Tax=Solanum demissum TaxID=50514 RepID=Q6L3Z8_SOLDE|nr:NB-ARC domain containing protein [Solanum demissum]
MKTVIARTSSQLTRTPIYSYKDLLLALLRDAIGEGSVRRELHANELADMLRKTLLPRSVWDDLRGCFPDVNNRSRIILTTRHHEVAKYASVHSDPLHLRMFDEVESWKLLEKKVFGEESCSPLLKNVGLRIAKMCGQLPLSIVLVAGILSEMEKEVECWEQVANNLEDRVIDISRLIRLWISESFIKSSEGRSLEDIAEGYLENLIGKNLVMVTKRAISDGKVTACHLHDVLLDFCKERAAEENFLLWIKRDQSTKAVYSHKLFTEIDTLVEWSESCSLVGSVLFKSYDPYFARRPLSSHAFAISHILLNFKFLKVLDLEHQVVIDFIPTELPYLRYFPIRLEILKLYRSKAFKTIPFCISAPNLKYLKLSGFYLDSQYLSETADHLKHLEVLILYNVEFGDHREWKVSNGKFPQLKILKLEYLSLMKWIVADDAFPNLEQLVLRGCRDLMEIPSCFMDILSLQYIKVENCNESVVKSAMNIQETQVEYYQNTNFKLVLIKIHLFCLFDMKGIESVSTDIKEKILTVTGDVDADEVQLLVEKLRKRGMPGL